MKLERGSLLIKPFCSILPVPHLWEKFLGMQDDFFLPVFSLFLLVFAPVHSHTVTTLGALPALPPLCCTCAEAGSVMSPEAGGRDPLRVGELLGTGGSPRSPFPLRNFQRIKMLS